MLLQEIGSGVSPKFYHMCAIFPNGERDITGLCSCTILCVIIDCKYVPHAGIYTDLHRSTLGYINPYVTLASRQKMNTC